MEQFHCDNCDDNITGKRHILPNDSVDVLCLDCGYDLFIMEKSDVTKWQNETLIPAYESSLESLSQIVDLCKEYGRIASHTLETAEKLKTAIDKAEDTLDRVKYLKIANIKLCASVQHGCDIDNLCTKCYKKPVIKDRYDGTPMSLCNDCAATLTASAVDDTGEDGFVSLDK